jgi:hypothetical protein
VHLPSPSPAHRVLPLRPGFLGQQMAGGRAKPGLFLPVSQPPWASPAAALCSLRSQPTPGRPAMDPASGERPQALGSAMPITPFVLPAQQRVATCTGLFLSPHLPSSGLPPATSPCVATAPQFQCLGRVGLSAFPSSAPD